VKDATTFVRVFTAKDGQVDVPGFVRALDLGYSDMFALRLLVLCDEDPIVWRLRLAVVQLDTPTPCLTGLTYLGRWPNRGVVFLHPPTRASDEPWKPHLADMTLVAPHP
jgi:hypothetical protein